MVMYLPEEDPLSLALQEQGFDSTLFVKTLGNIFYAIFGYVALSLLLGSMALIGKKVQFLHRVSSKVRKIIFWNGLIRFYIEIYMDVAVCAFLNLKTMTWNDHLPALNFSNYFAILAVISLCVIPVGLIVFFAKRMNSWIDDDFQNKYGTLIEGANLNI